MKFRKFAKTLIASVLCASIFLTGCNLPFVGSDEEVTEESVAIELSKSKVSLEVDEDTTVKIKNYDDLKKVKVEVDDEEIATVDVDDEKITITGIKSGKAIITVSAKGCADVMLVVTVEGEDVVEVPAESTTVMIYMIGSNLESDYGAASEDLEEILASDYGDTKIVIQTGGADEWWTDGIEDGKVQRWHVEDSELVEDDNLGKLSMSDADNLADFITYAAENYPSENNLLVLWDHGGGIPIGYGYDEVFPNDFLYDVDIKDALDTADVQFGAVIFDACNMCTLEVALALQDHSDYMVAAESYVNGIGIYYTNWLGQTGSDQDSLVQDYCETIVSDYMDTLDEENLVGSMSVIKLSKIDEVYDAYVDYIGSCLNDLENGGYENYYTARNNCGYYEGTDSVDLCTLCTQYDTDFSTPLFNAVVNAVVYTESDMRFGHGICAYSPFDNFVEYDWGRQSLVTLGYDDTILEFYDTFTSLLFDFYAPDYIDYYAGDWYVASGESSSNYTLSSYTKGEDLEVTQKDTYFALELTDDDWDMIYSTKCNVFVELDEDTLFNIGSVYYGEYDNDGDLMIVDPEQWVWINDDFATYNCVDLYYDPDYGMTEYGYIDCCVNDQDALMVVYFDDENPDGIILGYYLYDFVEDEKIDDTMYYFEDDDLIDLIYYVYFVDTDEEYFYNMDDGYRFGDLTLDRDDIDLSDLSTYLYYTIEDYYGNEYETEMVYYYI